MARIGFIRPFTQLIVHRSHDLAASLVSLNSGANDAVLANWKVTSADPWFGKYRKLQYCTSVTYSSNIRPMIFSCIRNLFSLRYYVHDRRIFMELYCNVIISYNNVIHSIVFSFFPTRRSIKKMLFPYSNILSHNVSNTPMVNANERWSRMPIRDWSTMNDVQKCTL